MKRMQKIAITAAAVVGMAGLGSTVLYAAEQTTVEFHPMSNLVTAIAQRFNLNEADVQQVFDEEHAKMRVDMETKMAEHLEDRLAKSVEEGILTQAQADAIIAKQQEMKTLFETLKDKTPEERRAALEGQKEALRLWAEENGIDEKFVSAFGPRPGMPGMKIKMKRFGHGQEGEAAPTLFKLGEL